VAEKHLPMTMQVELPQILGSASLRPDSAMEREALDEDMAGWDESPTPCESPLQQQPPPGSNRTRFLKTMSASQRSAGNFKRSSAPRGGAKIGGGPGRPNTALEARDAKRPISISTQKQSRAASAIPGSGRVGQIDEGPVKADKPKWFVGTKPTRMLEEEHKKVAYALKANAFERPDIKGDPGVFDPMQMVAQLNEADRKACPRKAKDGRYNLLEARRARPASAFQTMSQMSGMLVKRASGGVPEPLDIVSAEPRPKTAAPKVSARREKLKLAEELTINGEDKARNGRFHKAIPEYSAAIEANDQYAPAYWRRGSANWELGNYGAAIEDYNKLYMLDPKMNHSESARKHKLLNLDHKRRSRPAWGMATSAQDPLTGKAYHKNRSTGITKRNLNAAPTA